MFFMVSAGFFLLFKVPGLFFTLPSGFYGFSSFQVFFIVPGQFLWFFKVPGSFFMVISWFSLFFKVLGCFFRDSRCVLRVNHGSSSVFIFTGRFFMVSGGFSGFLFSRSGCHDSKWIFIVPGWFKSKLSAAGAK